MSDLKLDERLSNDDDEDNDDVEYMVATGYTDAVYGGKCQYQERDTCLQDGSVDTMAHRL